MASQKQIEANRLNALKSTGPRTSEGKARSSRNALKTGIDAKSQIIHTESEADLQTLAGDYYDRFRPTTPEQRMLVDALVDSEWLLRRFRRVEAQLWADGALSVYKPVPAIALGQAICKNCEEFARLQRRIDMAHRNYRNALQQLRQLQSEEAAVESAPEPAAVPASAPKPTAKPQSGFLPQPPAEPPTAGPADTASSPVCAAEKRVHRNF